MQTTKTIQAINGDRVQVSHPTLDLSHPMTTYATVRYDGVSHSVVSVPSPSASGMAMVTAQFTVNGHQVRIVEKIDANNVGKAAIRYEGVLETGNGTLRVQSYDSPDHTVALLAALDPQETPLGVVLGPDNEVDFVTVPEVILDVNGFAVLQINPLTKEVNNQLPEWQGTAVRGGELFGGRVSRSIPYLILVTPTARVHVMPADVPLDDVATMAGDLRVSWTP